MASRKTASRTHLDEPGLDELYAAPLADFIAARDELAASLRAEHDKPGAARIKALRKPSAAAWVINQLARGHARELAALIAAGERVRAAQGKGGAGLREASKLQRAHIAALMDAASEVLTQAGIRGQSGPLEGVRETLQALPTASDAELALLRRGVLTETLQPADISDVFKQLSMSGSRRRPAALPRGSEDEEDGTAESDAEDAEDIEEPASEATGGKRASAEKATAQKAAEEKATAKRAAAAKKAVAKRAASRRAAAKKAARQRAAAKKTATKQRAREAARERLEREAERTRRADVRRARDEASREANAAAKQAERAAAAAQRAEERARRAEDAANEARERAHAAERAARAARARAAEAARRLESVEADLELA